MKKSPLDTQPVFAVSSVVVDIDNRHQTCLLGIAYDLSHAVHPCLVYLVFWSRSDMSQPRDRDTYRCVPFAFRPSKVAWVSLCIAPGSFAGYTIVLSVELVAEVPSESEFLRYRPGIVCSRHYLLKGSPQAVRVSLPCPSG